MTKHASDCAVHNAPALEPGPCDCGGMENDCTKCLARLDGTGVTYCYHKAFEVSHPGCGPVIPDYPKAPTWCPGMVRENETAEPTP